MKAIYTQRIVILTMAILTLSLGSEAQGLYIGNGADIVAKGPASLVLKDAGLINNGSFAADSSMTLFTGNTASGLLIDGSSTDSFYNLAIDKPGGQMLVNQTICVGGELDMRNGNLSLANNSNLRLVGAGHINGERDRSYIMCSSGSAVIIRLNLAAPQALNPGNIGLELTSNANLGLTTISRLDNPQVLQNGAQSIRRYFVIFSTNNRGLNASIRMYYLDTLLNGNAASGLNVWLPSDTVSEWVPSGRDSSSQTGKWVALGHIDDFSQLTLGDSSVVVPQTASPAAIQWQLYPNPVHNQITLVLISQVEKDEVIGLYDQSGHPLQRKALHLHPGQNSLSWNVSPYVTGIYYLEPESKSFKGVPFIKK